MSQISFPISRQSYRTITASFYKAIDNKDTEVFYLLNSFLNNQLSEVYNTDDETRFDFFSTMFPNYYEYALGKLNTSITFKGIFDVCVDSAVRGIKSKAGFGSGFKLPGDKISVDEKIRNNKYIRIILNRFSEVINICLRKRDLNSLPFILEKLNQIYDGYDHKLAEAKFEIQLKKSPGITGADLESLNTLERNYKIDSFSNDTVRLIFKVTLYWSLFLYNTNTLSIDDLEKILEVFRPYFGYIEHDFVEDLLELRSIAHEHAFSWGNWDYTDRMDGVVYTPPSLHYWATLGSILYVLMKGMDFDFQLDKRTSSEVTSIEFLINTMDQILGYLEEHGYKKYGILVKASDEKAFKIEIGNLQKSLVNLRSTTITNKEELIARENLDPDYVSNFKTIIIKGWEKANTLRKAFIYFDNIYELIDNKGEAIQVGFRNQIWMGLKTCLIKNADLYTPLMSIERTGEDLAQFEENAFLGFLFRGVKTSIGDIFSGLDSSIQNIQNAEFAPSVIMMGYTSWHIHFGDLKKEHYLFDPKSEWAAKFSNYGGSYKGVLILKFRSELLQNVVIVSDFKKSFKLYQEKKHGAYEDVLVNEISEITARDAEEIIAENPKRWEMGLEHDKAVLKIMNSVKIEFYLVEKFEILSANAFQILTLN